MKPIDVRLGERSYSIHIANGLIERAGALLAEKYAPCGVAVVSDENVFALYGQKLLASLKAAGFSPFTAVLQPGEASKSLDTLRHLYDTFAQHGLNRRGIVVALGGGVVGDVAGFAAATYMRGVALVQIPTTLLAQVDSSVGGKVAVNLGAGKNLVGAFYQPGLVLADTSALTTLSARDFSGGMAEVIKYGAIMHPSLLDLLENTPPESLARHMDGVIQKCCECKRDIVQRDELDLGERMILNFGHTFGHAIEKHYGYGAYTHGEAVSIGMVMAARFGEALGLSGDLAARLSKILSLHKLPTACDAGEALPAHMGLDKKNDGGVTLVLLRAFGEPVVQTVSPPKLVELGRQAKLWNS